MRPARQAFFIGLAVVGIAAGYGLGYLFKGQPPEPAPAAAVAAPPAPATPAVMASGPVSSPAAPPLLPEGVKPAAQSPVRAYEEALPKNVVEHHAAAQPTDAGAAPQNAPVGATENSARPVPDLSATAQPSPAPSVSTDAGSPPHVVASAPAAGQPAVRIQPPTATPENRNLPAWRKFAVAVPASEGRPRIAIVIDDLGIDKPRTQRAIHLRAPLTLSFLTYASGLKELTAAARAAGHEILMHVPMEPGGLDVDPGPNVLLTGIPREELDASLRWNLDQFDGYVGINNHMGSRFTADLAGMMTVMEELRRRNLMFLDSITAGNSVAAKAARRVGVPFVRRNVFIDHEDNVESINRQLAQVERLAAQTGVAVAIGHPREATLKALIPWLAGVDKKGFQLVPISAVLEGGPSSRG